MGICCGAGSRLESVWQSLLDHQVCCTQPQENFFPPHQSSPLFTVQEDNPLAVINSLWRTQLQQQPLRDINRTTALALLAATQALEQSQIGASEIRRKRLGIVVGTTVGCTFHNEDYYLAWKTGQDQDVGRVLAYIDSNIAARLHAILGTSGPRAVVTSACTSATDAIGLAHLWLENDLCDVALAGGCDEISRFACHGFSSLKLLSPAPCRPFDRDRQGLNIGEGAGILVMESTGHAAARGGRVLGKVLGYGCASDAYHPTAPHPQGLGLQRAVVQALAAAGISLDDIAYINAHGTGTRTNDLAELTALQHLGLTADNPAIIQSSKGLTGHTLGAAGGIEAVITLQSLHSQYAPGTTGCTHPDPDLPLPVLTENDGCTLHGCRALNLSLAFGGGNSALILEASA